MPKPTLFVVTDELQQVLNNLPALEPKSRLDPLCSFIMRWRREGRSYRMIQEILQNECKVRIHNETLRRFVKRRLKPRKPKLEPELQFESEQPTSSVAPPPARTGKRLTPEERAAQVAYIRSLNKPAVAEEKPKLLFDFDPDKPRTNHPKKEEINGNNSSSN
jgi:hypothetical protein